MNNTDYELVVKDVSKSFGTNHALRKINLSVQKGEFVSIFGPNGAGKTTLIKILSTLLSPTDGELHVGGKDIKQDVESIRSMVGLISHDPYIYENLSAFENITFFATLYGLSDPGERAKEVIREIGLEARMHELVRNFSRGMKQRLAVARAIVHKPNILLLDEPYAGLDRHGSAIFTDMLSRFKNERKTIVMTTHNVNDGLELSDRVLIISAGSVVFESTVDGELARDFNEIYNQKTNSSSIML